MCFVHHPPLQHIQQTTHAFGLSQPTRGSALRGLSHTGSQQTCTLTQLQAKKISVVLLRVLWKEEGQTTNICCPPSTLTCLVLSTANLRQLLWKSNLDFIRTHKTNPKHEMLLTQLPTFLWHSGQTYTKVTFPRTAELPPPFLVPNRQL